MSAETRFAVIGAGRAGMLHARNLRRNVPGAKLVAICDASAETLATAGDELGVDARFQDFDQLIDGADLDAVVIVTPTFLHAEVACQAAAAGLHVFLEKPMALTIEECESMNEATKAADVRLQIGFMRRFDRKFQQAKSVIESGDLGRPMIVKSTGRGPGGPGRWMYDLAKSNGIVAEVNSHDIDTLRWFAGSDYETVYALGRNFKSPDAREDFPDFYDNVVAQFQFRNDTLGQLDGTCPAHYGYDARVEVLCEKGVMFIGHAEQSGLTWIDAQGRTHGQAVVTWRELFKDAYLAEMCDFVRCIEEGRDPSVTGQDGLQAVRAVIGINESIKTGQVIHLTEDVRV